MVLSNNFAVFIKYQIIFNNLISIGEKKWILEHLHQF
jgi:hypothetical protein